MSSSRGELKMRSDYRNSSIRYWNRCMVGANGFVCEEANVSNSLRQRS